MGGTKSERNKKITEGKQRHTERGQTEEAGRDRDRENNAGCGCVEGEGRGKTKAARGRTRSQQISKGTERPN